MAQIGVQSRLGDTVWAIFWADRDWPGVAWGVFFSPCHKKVPLTFDFKSFVTGIFFISWALF